MCNRFIYCIDKQKADRHIKWQCLTLDCLAERKWCHGQQFAGSRGALSFTAPRTSWGPECSRKDKMPSTIGKPQLMCDFFNRSRYVCTLEVPSFLLSFNFVETTLGTAKKGILFYAFERLSKYLKSSAKHLMEPERFFLKSIGADNETIVFVVNHFIRTLWQSWQWFMDGTFKLHQLCSCSLLPYRTC